MVLSGVVVTKVINNTLDMTASVIRNQIPTITIITLKGMERWLARDTHRFKQLLKDDYLSIFLNLNSTFTLVVLITQLLKHNVLRADTEVCTPCFRFL